MLPACVPNFVSVARTTWMFEQACCIPRVFNLRPATGYGPQRLFI